MVGTEFGHQGRIEAGHFSRFARPPAFPRGRPGEAGAVSQRFEKLGDFGGVPIDARMPHEVEQAVAALEAEQQALPVASSS